MENGDVNMLVCVCVFMKEHGGITELQRGGGEWPQVSKVVFRLVEFS